MKWGVSGCVGGCGGATRKLRLKGLVGGKWIGGRIGGGGSNGISSKSTTLSAGEPRASLCGGIGGGGRLRRSVGSLRFGGLAPTNATTRAQIQSAAGEQYRTLNRSQCSLRAIHHAGLKRFSEQVMMVRMAKTRKATIIVTEI